MDIHRDDTAIVFIDPQNEVSSEKRSRVASCSRKSARKQYHREHGAIFEAAKAHGFEVFICPHYFYPVDKGWKFNGPLETDEGDLGSICSEGSPESRRSPRIRRRLAGTL